MSAVFLFAVFAAVDLLLPISENEDMIQSLLDGSDTSRVLAADHVLDLLGESELLLRYDLFIFNDVDRDVVIDESKDIQIHEIDRALNLHDVLLAHFAALGILDDGNAAVQFVEMKVFIDLHTLAGLDVIEYKAFRDTSYVQCILYHLSVPLFL